MLTATRIRDRRIEDAETALARYFPLERYPVRARYVLQDLLSHRANP